MVRETWKKGGRGAQREEKQQPSSSRGNTQPYLDHAVTVGIGDVGLQSSKQSLIVVLEIEVLQP